MCNFRPSNFETWILYGNFNDRTKRNLSLLLKKGDKILEINGKVVNSIKTSKQALEAIKVGEKYDVLILRDNQKKTISIVAEGYKSQQ